MIYLETFNENKKSEKEVDIKTSIKYVRGISQELKDDALPLLKQYSTCKKGKISGLELHPDLKKRIKEKDLPNGFDMGVDKNGYSWYN